MGESALLGRAVADPVAGRLQRVFGVSQLKIDPSFTSGTDTPNATLTLQQSWSLRVGQYKRFVAVTPVTLQVLAETYLKPDTVLRARAKPETQ